MTIDSFCLQQSAEEANAQILRCKYVLIQYSYSYAVFTSTYLYSIRIHTPKFYEIVQFFDFQIWCTNTRQEWLEIVPLLMLMMWPADVVN
jgi:hypothetical protein